MSEPIDAIYENGVFKPLTPPNLPEKSQVVLTVGVRPEEANADTVARQKAAWRKLWKEAESKPHDADEGWSATKVDDVLYGGPDGPA